MEYVGKGVRRRDIEAKVRGRALYAADYRMDGMLEVSLVRSPSAHGILKGVTPPVLPENCFFFTSRDIDYNYFPSILNEQPVLASDHIRFHGEPIAIVAAPTKAQADEIASAVIVDIEELPVADDMEKALDPDSPKLFAKGNLCADFHSDKGDTEMGFGESVFVLEDTFETPAQSHGFLETESALTYIDKDGKLTIISSTQNPYAELRTVAAVTGRAESDIKSRAAVVGGGFGGKDLSTSQAFPSLVTHKTGRPARYVFTREENIRYGFKRHKSVTHVKVGFDGSGKILAAECSMDLDTGAYALYGPSVLNLGMEHFAGAYSIENVRLDGRLIYTNHAPASAMRGFGAPQAAFAFESMLNRAAAKLNVTQLEIRRMNAIHTGEAMAMGGACGHSIGLGEALDKFGKSDFYREMTKTPEKDCGYSLAVGMMSSGLGKGVPDTCHVDILKDEAGRYDVRTSLVDLGQGSRTVLAQIACDALGVGEDKVTMTMGDTELSRDSGSTAASRSTFACGNAIVMAAEEIKSGKEEAHASFDFPEAEECGVHSHFAFSVVGAKVRVDRTCGRTDVLWMHSVIDAGNVVNPPLMDGQVFGGEAMSLGMTLSEEIRYADGKSLESDFASYVMPTAVDAPKFTCEYVVKPEPDGPFGAKGMAELPTVAVAPAIASAVGKLVPEAKLNKLPLDRIGLLVEEK